MSFKLTILTFHKVVDNPYFIPPMAVSVKTFKGLLKRLHWLGRIISLSQAAEEIKNDTLRGNNLAITFDDGYLDNYGTAANILLNYRLPATFFVPFNQIEKQEIFWWDHVFFLVEKNFQRFHQWFAELNQTISIDGSKAPEKYARQVVQVLNGLSENKRHQIISGLNAEFGKYKGPRQLMTWDEIKSLVHKGFEIGSHTLSHIPLTHLDDRQAKYEISYSKKCLSDKIGQDVKGFCYPRGAFESPHLEMVRQSGYTYAVSTKFGSNTKSSNTFAFNRRAISDYPDFRNTVASGIHLFELTGALDSVLLKRRIA